MIKSIQKLFSHVLFTRLITLVLVSFLLYFVTYYLRSGSIPYYTDIGRDMLLLEELAVKKVTFIGARTSLQGVFHGPVWLYLNLPAFLLTHGDPMQMAWYWFALILVFLVSIYVTTAKLFDERAAGIATVLVTIHMIGLVHLFTNPIGAFFLIPLFFFCILMYARTDKLGYLLAHLLLGGFIIQFEMMLGVPLLILSFVYCLVLWMKSRRFLHILSFCILAVPLSTFLLFDVRHNFLQFNSLIDYVTGRKDQFPSHKPILMITMQKFELMTREGLGIFPMGQLGPFNALALAVFASAALAWKKTKEFARSPLTVLLYYFVGYYVLTYVLKDTLLFHYYYPLMYVPILAFAALHNRTNKYLYGVILLLVLYSGVFYGKEEIRKTHDSVGRIEDDWKFLHSIAASVYAGPEKDFGYFVYSPDVYAYQQKYAMSYERQNHPDKKVSLYVKRPVTYLVIAPPTGTGVELSASDWKKDKIKINKKPIEVHNLAGRYIVEKYELTPAEMAIEPAFDVQNSIYFR